MKKRKWVVSGGAVALALAIWGMGCLGGGLSTLRVAEDERSFLVHVPKGYGEAKRYPLVVAMHQFTDTPKGTESLTGFSELADAEGFFVVYPKGIMRGWNAGMRESPNDVAFIEALIDEMARKYSIDSTRIYACGLSAGGMMAQWLACRTDRFAAVAALAGSLTTGATANCSNTKPTPVLLMHGTEDTVVPYAGGETYAGPGMRPVFLSAEAGAQYWADHNGCTGAPQQEELAPRETADDGRVIKYTYPCTAAAEVLRYEVRGGGHTWPGRKNWYPAFIVGPTSAQIDATAEIWAFFKRHALPASG